MNQIENLVEKESTFYNVNGSFQPNIIQFLGFSYLKKERPISEEVFYQCLKCPEVTSNEELVLRNHILKRHKGGIELYKCKFCDQG